MEKNISTRLKITRIKLGFKNQTAFAEKLGIKQGSLSKYESGMNEIPDDVKVKISQFGINIHWLVTGKGNIFAEEIIQPESDTTIENIEKFEEQLNDASNTAEKMKEVRLNLGKTQEEMAETLGIARETWKNYESGMTAPPLKIKMKLADLNYPISNLSNNIMLGGNITQTIGDNNTNITAPSNSKQEEDSTGEDIELFHLIRNYAPPKLKQELREKLLKIKELSDE